MSTGLRGEVTRLKGEGVSMTRALVARGAVEQLKRTALPYYNIGTEGRRL